MLSSIFHTLILECRSLGPGSRCPLVIRDVPSRRTSSRSRDARGSHAKREPYANSRGCERAAGLGIQVPANPCLPHCATRAAYIPPPTPRRSAVTRREHRLTWSGSTSANTLEHDVKWPFRVNNKKPFISSVGNRKSLEKSLFKHNFLIRSSNRNR